MKIDNTQRFDEVRAEAETLAGFLLEATQVIPVPGKKFILEGYIFTIEAIENNRIQRIKVTIPKKN
jgi:CBS domain containing-hemolysin-like protein